MNGVETDQATVATVGVPLEMAISEPLLHLHSFQVLNGIVHKVQGDNRFLTFL